MTRQDIEISRTMHAISELINGNSCKENFSGLLISTPKGVINAIRLQHPEAHHILKLFPVQRARFDDSHQLMLRSYSLSPTSGGHLKREGVVYLEIEFDRGGDLGSIEKELKLFVEVKDSTIIDCSLFPLEDKGELWRENLDGLVSEKTYFQINTNSTIGTLNLKGGLIAHSSLKACDRRNHGSLYWDESQMRWSLCKVSGLMPLKDNKLFSDLKLREMKD